MATEHAIISEPMELPSLPPNQGLEAMKDIVFGSVRDLWRLQVA
jgi:ornithine carrier protein